jgi:phosphohistidine swiveling domain-containing protein
MTKKISFEKLEKMIVNLGLTPNLRRDISLLGHSTFCVGYSDGLKKLGGFTYNAFGTLWRDGVYHSMVNNDDISKKVELALRQGPLWLDQTLKKAMDIFSRTAKRFKEISVSVPNKTNYSLEIMLENYVEYTASMGLYNSLYRYLGNKSVAETAFDVATIDRIGIERNEVAKLYPEVERCFIELGRKVGKVGGFDGNLIPFMTYNEVIAALRGKEFSPELLSEAKKRRDQYFYICNFDEGREFIMNDKVSTDRIYHEFYEIVPENSQEVTGIVAFKGKVRGAARVLNPSDKPGNVTFREGEILIAAHTNLDFMALIQKCSAIVADEGGALSHAAVISRELKKPCVIGTKVATKVFKDGDLVEVDAERGIVKIIQRQ